MAVTRWHMLAQLAGLRASIVNNKASMRRHWMGRGERPLICSSGLLRTPVANPGRMDPV